MDESTDAFAELHPVVQHHIVNTLGWSSLRPLQSEAVAPVLSGEDALLLAPTAGGKTEAALFPLLSRMAQEGWTGLSVLYLCPLRALLNNLEPRVAGYAAWLGRTAVVRHGDTTTGARRRQSIDHPDILLTTPESLESMLVSAVIDPRAVLSNVRAVVIDEVHAFAGDDRGWHLLAVLERLAYLNNRPLQRIGLSATVGNAPELLDWLQGSGRAAGRKAQVVAPQASGAVVPELELDFVGNMGNAAKVISSIHQGEKRLVFADSRRTVEELSLGLREFGAETFVSHSSLSVGERRRSEAAFAEARNCVIVSTSTLELGIDVGDLDRVIQVGAPGTVASLLQRLGRTGRRTGTSRNMLFLAATDDDALRAAGLLLLWSEGYVEPVLPPLQPNHLVGQQLLALALQERRVGRATWGEWLGGLGLASPLVMKEITDWMVSSGHLDQDTDMLFIGAEAERRYGRRSFMEVMSVFTSDPQVTVLHGRNEIGVVDPMVLVSKVEGPRIIGLAGRAWKVTHIDWTRKRAHVEPSEGKGLARWTSIPQPRSYALTDACRRVLLGQEISGVHLTSRAVEKLDQLRGENASRVDATRTVLVRDETNARWWTWAGGRANAVLAAMLELVSPGLVIDTGSFDNQQISLSSDIATPSLAEALQQGLAQFGSDLKQVRPAVSQRAVEQLKFAEMLPPDLAMATLASRTGDHETAAEIAQRPLVVRNVQSGA